MKHAGEDKPAHYAFILIITLGRYLRSERTKRKGEGKNNVAAELQTMVEAVIREGKQYQSIMRGVMRYGWGFLDSESERVSKSYQQGERRERGEMS